MFWRMAGLSTASAVEAILDKDGFTLEELLDEDEIIQECKSLNGRLLNFLRERVQVEQLIRYIIEEPLDDVEKKRTFKFPFVACEIFTCEIEMILKTLVEDEELMLLLFSFLEAKETHNSLLVGYFSKVVICLLVRKTIPFMQFIKDHQEILKQLVDLIGITSIMEVIKRLLGTDEHLYSNYASSMQWVEDTDVLEMIVDKFGSSESPEVHANAAEILCTVARYAPPGLATKLSSPSCTGRLLKHTLEDSRPKSVLVNSLSVCISLLDPKRFTLGTYHIYGRQLTQGSMVTNPETVEGMLGSLGDLLMLLNVSSTEGVLLTTYGKLQPPLGKHRLKIVEFISVLLTVGSEAAEKEIIRLGVVKRVLDLFFEYPYNNFVHHHVENVILSCLESKNSQLLDHLLNECNLIGSMLEAEKDPILTAADSDKPTVPAEGRKPLRIGSIGHLTRISNKLLQLANSNVEIQSHLQENSEWVDWQTDVLSKRNTLENVYSWACGRPTSLHDRNRDSDDDDYHDRDYDVAALANNLSQAFRYGVYNNDDMDETQGSMERGDDEDVYFDDESAEVVISSLRLGDDQESSSLFTNSNWFAFDDEKVANEQSMASPSPSADEDGDVVIGEADDDFKDSVASSSPDDMETEDSTSKNPSENPSEPEAEKSPAWVEWRETSESTEPSSNTDEASILPNGQVQNEKEDKVDDTNKEGAKDSSPGACGDETIEKEALELVKHGATLLFLDVPQHTLIGIDTQMFTVGPAFKGIKMIPPGIHFVFYSSSTRDGKEFSPTIGFFIDVAPSQVLVRKWNQQDEWLVKVSEEEEERYSQAVKSLEFDKHLGPFNLSQYGAWKHLSNYITKDVIEKFEPVGGEITVIYESAILKGGPKTEMERALDEQMKKTKSGAASSTTEQPKGNRFYYTSIPRIIKHKGISGQELTSLNLDKTQLLESVLSKEYKDSEDLLLGELQFSFVAFLMGQSLESFMQWKSLVSLLLGCTEAPFQTRSELFTKFIKVIYHQLKYGLQKESSGPEMGVLALLDDSWLASDSFLHLLCKDFFALVEEASVVDGDLLSWTRKFKELLESRLGWEFQKKSDVDGIYFDEDDEYAPVVEMLDESHGDYMAT